MAKDGETFEQWLDDAKIPQRYRSPQQLAVLEAVFVFLQRAGSDYAEQTHRGAFSVELSVGLEACPVARLVGVTRPTASRQNKISSRQVVREIQHRLSGRPYGKLLPRYAGPIAQFLMTHPDANRDDLVDFIEGTFSVRISLTALHKFLKKSGLDRKSLEEAATTETPHPCRDERELLKVLEQPASSGRPVACPPDDSFFWPHPICRRVPVAPASAELVGNRPTSAFPMTTVLCRMVFSPASTCSSWALNASFIWTRWMIQALPC